MTIAPDTPRLTFTNLADAVGALRERGLRLTTPRRLVLEALFSADGPVSAEYVASSLNLEVTSVYRNLEALEQHGLARHVHLGHGPGLYALVGRGEREFLSCERCGAVRTLTADELDPVRDEIRALFGYEARFTHFAIVGLCPACARRPEATTPQPTEADGHATTATKRKREHPHGHEHSHGDHVHSHPHSHQQGGSEPHGHDHRATLPQGAALPQTRVD
jgi:Fur family ferric uptake transcriptional regulator